MNFQLNNEDIDKFIRDAILQAGFSGAVQKGINDALNGYDSPIKKALNSYLANVCRELIEQKLGTSIREQLASAIEKQITNEMTEKIVYESVKKIVDAVERY